MVSGRHKRRAQAHFEDKHKTVVQETAKKQRVKLTKEDSDANHKCKGEVSIQFGDQNTGTATKGNCETGLKSNSGNFACSLETASLRLCC